MGTEPGDGLPPLRDVVARYGLRTKKSLGQHFLHDLNLTARIARAAGAISQGTVIEIGPGPGGLTRALLAEGAGRVIAVERDERCLEALAEIQRHWPDRLEIIAADAMETDVAMLGTAPRRVVANLPYNIGTVLLLQWLERMEAFESFTLMLQKEVVDRLAAAPGRRAYGRLSVAAQWRCEVRSLFTVGRENFSPPPQVASAVVSLIPRPEPLAPARWPTLELVARTAFGQRRKMLRAALKSLGDAGALLDAAGIEPTLRAGDVPVEGFCALANALDAARDR